MDIEHIPARAAFVVWVARDIEGDLEGVVERVRTGEKHRFHGIEALGALIVRMTSGNGADRDPIA